MSRRSSPREGRKIVRGGFSGREHRPSARSLKAEALEPRTLLAFSPLGGEFPVNTYTANQQSQQVMASDADGDFVIAWSSVNQDGGGGSGGYGIFAQRFTADGVARGAEFQVNQTIILNQKTPAIAMDADGDFVIAWEGATFDAVARYEIYARRYSATGTVLGGEFRVNNATADLQIRPSVAMDADGDFVVAWQDASRDGAGYGIYARRFDSIGDPLGDDFAVNATAADNQVDPSVATDAAGNFVVAWETRLPNGAPEGFYARRFSASGTPLGGDFKLNTLEPISSGGPAAAMDLNGDFAIAFPCFQAGVGQQVIVRRYNAAGVAQGLGFRADATSFAGFPSLSMDARGGFVVAWSGFTGSGDDVFARRYDPAGAPLGAQFPVNTTTADTQSNPTVAMDLEGDFVVAWQSFLQDGSSYGVYARRYDESPDTTGPIITDVRTLPGTQIKAGAIMVEGPDALALTFSEEMSAVGGATGVNSVNNKANYVLTRNGANVSSQISAVAYGYNLPRNAFEVNIIFSAPLAGGDYVLTATQALRDLLGNALDGNYDGTPGVNFTRAFSVRPVVKLGGEFLVNTATSGNQAEPTVASDGNGNFVVAWQSDAQDGSGYGVYAKRYTAAGAPLPVPGGGTNTEFRVNVTTANNQSFPSVARNASGAFVVAFDGGTVSDRDVFVRRYAPDGSPAGTSDLRVNTTTTFSHLGAAVAVDAAGNFVVVWQQSLLGAPILAQRFSAAGTPVGGELIVSAPHGANGAAFAPAVAMGPGGNFVVVWHIYDADGSLAGVYARRYDVFGNPQGAEFRVNTTTADNQAYPSVAMDEQGDFVVAWTSYGGQDGSGTGVYFQRYNAAGAPQGAETRGNTYTANDQNSASVAMDKGGNFVIAWESANQDGAGDGIFAQRHRADGSRVGAEVRVNTATAGDQAHPSVATGVNGAFVVAWQSNLQDGSGLGIYAQRFGPDDAPFTTGIPDVTVFHDAPDTLIDLFAAFSDSTDADNQLSYSVVANSNPTVVSATTTVTPTAATLRLDYAAGRSGVANLSVRATDTSGVVADASFVVYVTPFAPAGGEFRANSTTAGNQESASVASDADGDFVIVWQSANQDGSGQGVYGQRYNAAGVPQGNELLVNTFTGGSQFVPVAAMDVDGDFVVAWTSRGQDGAGDEVYAQRFNAAGQRQGVEFRVNLTTAETQGGPSVAMDTEGGFVIAWESNSGASGFDVFARRYDPRGVPLTGEIPVNTFTDGLQAGAAVAMDSDGDFVVAWTGYAPQDTSGSGVYAQRFNAAGAPRGGNFLVNTFTANNQKIPSVAMDASGDFVIAWQDRTQDGSAYGVYAQRYAASGAALGGEFRVNTFTVNSQTAPAVGIDVDGDFVITWQDQAQDGSTYGIYARHYNAAGAPISGEFRINTFTTDLQSFPSVGMNASGDFVIAWGSRTQDSSEAGVYAQRYDNLTDTAPPVVTDVAVDGNVITNSERLVQPVSKVVVSFSEDLALPRGDVALTRNGVAVAIGSSTFFFNPVTNKYELTLALAAASGDGTYLLTVGPGMHDTANNVLDGNRDGSQGDAFVRAFTVAAPARVGPELRVNSTTSGDQRTAAVAMDADGDFVVTWSSYAGQDGSGRGVFAQRFSAAGAPLGPEFRVNTFTEGDQLRPALATDAAGNFVIVWDSAAQDGSGFGIYAQRYASNGTPIGGEFRVNTFTTGDQDTAAVAMNAFGDFAVAWQSLQDGHFTGIYLQRYDATGLARGVETQVNTTFQGAQKSAAVAIDANGAAIVAWHSPVGADLSEYGVYARRYNAAGTPLTGELLVNSNTADAQRFPAVSSDPAGNFVIAWDTTTLGSPGADVYARRFNSAGVPLGPDFPVNTFTPGFQQVAGVAVDDDGDAIIAWNDSSQDGSFNGIYARRYAADSAAITGEFRVNRTVANSQSGPAVAADADGDFVVVWHSLAQDGDGYGIYAQRFGPNSAPTTTGIGAISVTEDAPPTVIDLFAAFDDSTDADADLAYSIVSNSNPGLFSDLPINAAAGTLILQYAPGQTGNATLLVRAMDSGGLFVETPFLVTVTPGAPQVMGRRVFYNNSDTDGYDPAPNDSDDGAIAIEKQALLPGGVASFGNITSYARGINGVMIDVRHLPAATTTLSVTDFDFQSGVGDPVDWVAAPAPRDITIRRGAGVNGQDRITLVWPDGALVNTYLRVTVRAGATFGLAAPDVFYFGNLIGESGDNPIAAVVNVTDLARTRSAFGSAATAALATYDFNRDGRLNAADVLLVRTNQRHTLPLFTAPAAPAAPVAPAAGATTVGPPAARTATRPPRRALFGDPSPDLLA